MYDKNEILVLPQEGSTESRERAEGAQECTDEAQECTEETDDEEAPEHTEELPALARDGEASENPEAVEALLEEAEEEVPVPTVGKLDGGQNPDGTIKKGGLSKCHKAPDHPMAYGLKEAKILIANILADKNNQESLALALQERFDKDPVKFLLTFEPLLKRYEDVNGILERRPVRVACRGEVIIESD